MLLTMLRWQCASTLVPCCSHPATSWSSCWDVLTTAPFFLGDFSVGTITKWPRHEWYSLQFPRFFCKKKSHHRSFVFFRLSHTKNPRDSNIKQNEPSIIPHRHLRLWLRSQGAKNHAHALVAAILEISAMNPCWDLRWDR